MAHTTFHLHKRPNTLNLLTGTTGMRLGEIQVLNNQNIHEGYVPIENSWNFKYGMKDAKWRSVRDIPIVNFI